MPANLFRKDSTHFDLADAMAGRRLALHWQPRVDARALGVVGAEGLLRYRSPSGWRSVPELAGFDGADFGRLWTWQMGQVASVFSELREAGWMPTSDDPGFSISLNLSHKQFQTEAWAQQIFQLLERTGIPGACLEVELTEQGGIEEGLWVESAFEHLRAQGVAISLDDFPEGGSSLLRLARFKFDKVKIDRCMVPAMGESQEVWRKKREILSDLVDLIRDTGAEAVVEGVERVEQHNFLACLPIREWQGFLWGGAVPLDALAPRLRCLGAP